ncbi:lipid-A-disaccharide synthase [Neolewinella aurantiaca]|uniref:Lipid-A-disaccharide synthase n=1 Tax=Neolewinella aurantiaca TaxID=2602767 RepID=A0A5C7FXF6_9BACT|nr:lipid-A-disaccharide synthase [Neolewinella aurantiaca]TXF91159.1 lipid-A-disaccharide synthase [Neolewinella aurantiaca]
MRYYLISGEPSGDLHGAHLIRAIRAEDPEAEFRAWGGDLMENAGATIVKHYRDLAFMGVVQIVKNLPTILRNERFCKDDIANYNPDRLVLIDYSGFNLRIAKWARPEGYDISYYISPQVWASRSGRVKQIKANVDRMLVILPFEEAWYAERGVSATFVGHPLLDVVKEAEEKARPQGAKKVNESGVWSRESGDARLQTPDSRLKPSRLQIALLPGSRKQEISVGLPLMLAAAALHPEHDYVIAGAPAQNLAFYEQLIASCGRAPVNLQVVMNDTYGILQTAHAAVVTSGTATLETALFGVPQVVVYKGNWLAYRIARWMVGSRIKYISLVNLVMDAPVVPELIQADFNPKNLAAHLEKTIAGPVRDQQLNDLQRLREKLGSGGAAKRAARAIVTSS